MAPARTRLARKQNAGLLVGSPSFADTASRSRSQPKMEDNLFTSPKEQMPNAKQLTKRQLAVIEDLFSGELDEQAVLDKHKISRNRYNKWQSDDNFAEQFDRRIAGAYRQSVALIARYAPLAAAKLIQLTESEKAETARKACLDIISMPILTANRKTHPSSDEPRLAGTQPQSADTQQLTEQTAGRLLAVLAEEKDY